MKKTTSLFFLKTDEKDAESSSWNQLLVIRNLGELGNYPERECGDKDYSHLFF